MIPFPDVLQLSTADFGGGAERVAWDLFRAYRDRGMGSWLAVGRKRSDDPDVFLVEPRHLPRHPAVQGLLRKRYPDAALERTHRLMRVIRDPGVILDRSRGIEDFRYPGSFHVLELPPRAPDVLHCHNLHGGYFDLRALPALNRRIPTVLTLHDAWLLSGHCAHSFDCERWLIGCGRCPDLTIYPAVRRDATDINWRRKRDTIASSRLSLVTPCRWLLERAQRSPIASSVLDAAVIPYGIDLRTFHPSSRQDARAALSLPQGARILVFAAKAIRGSRWRDYGTLREALKAVRTDGKPILCLAVGEEAPPERFGETEIRFVPFVHNPRDIALFYQAADAYVHPALADTFPNAVLEALACGLPVIASAVGGIPEQVRDEMTGILVPPRDARGFRSAVERVLADDDLRARLASNAAVDAARRFNLNREVDDYLALYRTVIAREIAYVEHRG